MNDITNNAEKIATNTDDMVDMQVYPILNAIDIQINKDRIRKKHPTTFTPGTETTFTPGTETTTVFRFSTDLGPTGISFSTASTGFPASTPRIS